jgi:phenylpropionate dioxygenase-like ring-hydroxylating dioxygenase large terminal subunit
MSSQATVIRQPGRQPAGEGELLVDTLLRQQPSGHSLLQAFYLSPEIYALDRERFLLRHWHCVGHESQVKAAGDYFLFEIDKESVIVIRGRDEKIRGLVNVCRHRGSRICDKATGHAKGGILICPYHAWTYRTDGSLRNARMMPEGFDVSDHGLRQVAVEIIEGLIFVSLAQKPLGFTHAGEMLRSTVGPFGWAKAKIIHRETFMIEANWKLALENQVECYHCGPAHPDFSRVHSQGHPGEEAHTASMWERAAAGGTAIPIRDRWGADTEPGEEADYCNRYALWGDAVTGSEDGKPVAPLMGRIGEYDGGFTVFYVGPLNHFLAYGDYGAIFRYTPRSVSETELHVTWLVREDAKEGVDYDVGRVTWLWRVTAGADKKIVEENQIGVNSSYYTPGPYALPIESKTLRFTEWYLRELTADQ